MTRITPAIPLTRYGSLPFVSLEEIKSFPIEYLKKDFVSVPVISKGTTPIWDDATIPPASFGSEILSITNNELTAIHFYCVSVPLEDLTTNNCSQWIGFGTQSMPWNNLLWAFGQMAHLEDILYDDIEEDVYCVLHLSGVVDCSFRELREKIPDAYTGVPYRVIVDCAGAVFSCVDNPFSSLTGIKCIRNLTGEFTDPNIWAGVLDGCDLIMHGESKIHGNIYNCTLSQDSGDYLRVTGNIVRSDVNVSQTLYCNNNGNGAYNEGFYIYSSTIRAETVVDNWANYDTEFNARSIGGGYNHDGSPYPTYYSCSITDGVDSLRPTTVPPPLFGLFYNSELWLYNSILYFAGNNNKIFSYSDQSGWDDAAINYTSGYVCSDLYNTEITISPSGLRQPGNFGAPMYSGLNINARTVNVLNNNSISIDFGDINVERITKIYGLAIYNKSAGTVTISNCTIGVTYTSGVICDTCALIGRAIEGQQDDRVTVTDCDLWEGVCIAGKDSGIDCSDCEIG